MHSTSAKQALDILEEFDSNLLASDFSSDSHIYILEEDGSSMLLASAFLVDINQEYIGVLAEHHDPMVFHKEELITYKQFTLKTDILTLKCNPDKET